MEHHYDEGSNLGHIQASSFINRLSNPVPAPTRDNAREALEGAKRNPKGLRYDILDPEFLYFMAKIAEYGVQSYGEGNWMKSRLTGEHGPVNHIYQHLVKYQKRTQYDHAEIGSESSMHLIAIAFNAMMEFWYENHLPG